MKNKRIILTVLTLLWACVIFSFSLQSGNVSKDVSFGFGERLIEIFLPKFARRMETMPQEEVEFLHHLLRKAAHFTEYLVLGSLGIAALYQTKLRYRPVLGLGFCVTVASLDETIQLFVSGRSAQISDVLLDSVGALVGMVLFLIAKNLTLRWKR